MDKLIFFDINGTLIKRDNRTDLPYEKAVNKCLNINNGLSGVNTSARSDKDVFMEVLSNNNMVFTDELWVKFLKIYETYLEEYKKTDVWRANVDAVDFVRFLYKKKYPLFLITGELSVGAKYKLEKIGIWKYFISGGFGEDGLERFQIADTALKKAGKIYPDYEESIIIGDTILDIKTARHINSEVISITTGSNTKEELEVHNPDHIVGNFSEIKHIF